MPEYKLSYTASEIDAKLGEIDNLAKKSEIPTKTSQLTNNSGFLTSIPSEYVTETELNTKGYLTEEAAANLGKAVVVEIVDWEESTVNYTVSEIRHFIDIGKDIVLRWPWGEEGDFAEYRLYRVIGDQIELRSQLNRAEMGNLTANMVTIRDGNHFYVDQIFINQMPEVQFVYENEGECSLTTSELYDLAGMGTMLMFRDLGDYENQETTVYMLWRVDAQSAEFRSPTFVSDDGKVSVKIVRVSESNIVTREEQEPSGGERGAGILKITTAPFYSPTVIGSVSYTYRTSLNAIQSEASVDEVLVGDQILYGTSLYSVDYKDNDYAYTIIEIPLKGTDASVTSVNIKNALGYVPASVTDLGYKVNKDQGVANAGKSLAVGEDGMVVLVDTLEVTAENIQTALGFEPAKQTDISGQIGTHNTATDAHNDIRLLVDGLTTRLNTLANSTDEDLDQMAEIVDYIKNNKSLIEGVTTNKVNVSDIINNLTTNVTNKPLSAAQGVALKALIDAIKVPTKVSELTNDAKYLTSVPAEYITETELTAKGYLTEHQSLANYATIANLEDLASEVVYMDVTDNENVENPDGVIIVDSELSSTSTNPVQNKVVTEKFNELSAEIGNSVKFTEQDLTDAEKAQARENIGAIGEVETVCDKLEFTYTQSYPNGTTFEYVVRTSENGYWLYKESTIQGGVLSVDWDTTVLTSFQILLYLFKNGEPYKYIQGYLGANAHPVLAGANTPISWIDPGLGSGYCTATAPFTVVVPEDCTIMVSMRSANAVYPAGSSWDANTFIKAVSTGFFDVNVSKTTTFSLDSKQNKSLGENNANKRLVTDGDGNISVGGIDPDSIALRPSWDTVIHRGWISGAFENTIPAFYLAKENGYSWVECDVRMSSDGIPVLAHDAAVTGTKNGASVTLAVAETSAADLQSVVLENHARFGEVKNGTLAELLNMARCLGMKILIDIKVSGETAMTAIAKTVLRYGMANNVVYMPIGTENAGYIASVDKNASFDFVQSGTSPTANTDFSAYTALLTGGNTVNFDIQANTWAFAEDDIRAINAAGCGLCFWNVLQSNLTQCIDAGAVRLTKHNNEDAVDLNAIYFDSKTFW